MKRDIRFFCICIFSALLGVLLSNGKFTIAATFNATECYIFDTKILLKIFINNLLVSFFISLGGYLTCGILSIVIIFWNGFLIGCLIDTIPASSENPFSLFVYHGVFEFFAFCFSGIVGMYGIDFYRNIFSNNCLEFNMNVRYQCISVVLLFIASIVETFLISL